MAIMIFGKNWSEKCHVGNVILGSYAFDNCAPPHECEAETESDGRHLTVVLTPNLMNNQLTQEDLQRRVKDCVSLCGPSPRAYILVAQPQDFKEDDYSRVKTILTSVLDQAFGSTLVVKFLPEGEDEDENGSSVDNIVDESDALRRLIQDCGGQSYTLNRKHEEDHVQAEILQKIENALDKDETHPVCSAVFEDAPDTQKPKMESDLVSPSVLSSSSEHAKSKGKVKTFFKKPFSKLLTLQRAGVETPKDTPDSTTDCVRIVLIGKTGVGKSATGNTILGKCAFETAIWGDSVTRFCQKDTAVINGQSVAVVDTPGLFDTTVSNEEVKKEILKCFSFLAPGPHVFLLVLSIGTRMTAEERETLNLIKEAFGNSAGKFIIILFTKGDQLKGHSIENYIQKSGPEVAQLIHSCEGRFHVFNNEDKNNRKQVTELMGKIDMMVKKNGGGCYTNEMFQMAESAIKEKFENIMREREEEIQREKEQLTAKFKEELRVMVEEKTKEIEREREQRDRMLKEKEEYINNELKRRDERERREREAEDEKRKEKEEAQRQEYAKSLKELEQKHQEQKAEWEMKHRTQLKEAAEKAAKEQEEWRERQRKERAEFEEKQKEERLKKDEEEKFRRESEERDKQKLEARVKDAEEMTAEVRMERQKELREWEEERKKEKEKEQQERLEWEKQQNKMKEDFDKQMEREIKARDTSEKERREQERKEREELEKQHAEKIAEIKSALERQEKEWTKAKAEEREKREREDEESRKKIRKLQEEYDNEMLEEKRRRKREDEDRELEHKKKLNEIEEQNQKKIEMLIKRYEDEARKKAEEFNDFLRKYNEDFHALRSQHGVEIDELRKRIREWEEHKKCVLL